MVKCERGPSAVSRRNKMKKKKAAEKKSDVYHPSAKKNEEWKGRFNARRSN